MRLLFVTSRFPYPLVKGDKVRGYYPIRHLAPRHTIDLLSFSEEPVSGAALREMQRYCQTIRVVNLNKLMFNIRLAAAICSPIPSQVFCYRSGDLRRRLSAMCHQSKYDVVHFVCGRIADYARQCEGVPTVLDWIDALSISTHRMAQQEKSGLKRLLYRWETKKIAAFEQRHIRTCSHSVVTSPLDQQALDPVRVELLPNGVDSELFSPAERNKDIDLIFTGNMSYFPNVQAVDYFCRDVFPLVRKNHPETRFFIVGIHPAKSVLKWKDMPGVVITGYVEEMPSMLNRSRIFVAPLQSGAGIQNKVLEAMACALPVVTTPSGAAGLGSHARRSLLISESPSDMASAIGRLLGSSDQCLTLGQQARSLVVERFSWAKIAARLEEIYVDISRAHNEIQAPDATNRRVAVAR